MYGTDRNAMRRAYAQAWQKRREGRPLEALEALMADLIEAHPEYHPLLENLDTQLERDWQPEHGETNPFLHLSLHLALREQVLSDRPAGIAALYKRLCDRHRDVLEAEHRLMDCLIEALWTAQRQGLPPDEAAYLECAQRLARG
ncbi:MAG: DUF1841 family protein [Halothiobacillaceae bacterium]|nr:DUF1841 family protein [Halothiobacillaceae bacterium]